MSHTDWEIYELNSGDEFLELGGVVASLTEPATFSSCLFSPTKKG